MKPINRSPGYLVRNPYSYCFRIRVTKDLQHLVKRMELRYSLKRGYAGVAKEKARFLAGQVQQVFRTLRKGGRVLSTLSDDEISGLIHVHYNFCLQRVFGWQI
jgi:hypothetical protein